MTTPTTRGSSFTQHQVVSSSALHRNPKEAPRLFWDRDDAACSSRFRSRAFSRSTSFTRRSTTRTFGPRFLECRAARVPCSTARRQAVSSEEYSPSRRRRAPISPGLLAALGFPSVPDFVLRRELARLGFGRNFRIRDLCHVRLRRRLGLGYSSRATRSFRFRGSSTCVCLGKRIMSRHRSSALFIKSQWVSLSHARCYRGVRCHRMPAHGPNVSIGRVKLCSSIDVTRFLSLSLSSD
jgi:hypothetical protein